MDPIQAEGKKAFDPQAHQGSDIVSLRFMAKDKVAHVPQGLGVVKIGAEILFESGVRSIEICALSFLYFHTVVSSYSQHNRWWTTKLLRSVSEQGVCHFTFELTRNAYALQYNLSKEYYIVETTLYILSYRLLFLVLLSEVNKYDRNLE